MIKPDHLRAWLTDAIPALAADPAQLQLFIDKGRVVATGTPGLAFEYRYTLNLLLTDYAGHPDGLFAPLLAWLSQQQPDLVQRLNRTGDGVAFEADILDNDRVDLSVTFELSEAVSTVPRDDGGFDVVHQAEPGPETWDGVAFEEVGPLQQLLLYLKGELVARVPAPAPV